MMSIKIDKNSYNAVVTAFNKFVRSHPGEVQNALLAETKLLMRRSKKQVPKNTGYLESSAYIRRGEMTNDSISMYAGYSADYAFTVHEVNKAYQNGKWKYLEDPLKQTEKDFNEKISRRVRNAIKKAFKK